MTSDHEHRGDGPVALRTDDVEVLVEPHHGGRLRALRIGGRAVVLEEGPEDPGDRAPIRGLLWGCFLMAPWVGRLRDGELRWEGRTHRLPTSLGGHAIHGLVAEVPWTVASATRTSVDLVTELGAAGWPFAGVVRQRYELVPGQLSFTASITAHESMPAALGWHPWIIRGHGDTTMTCDADHTLALDEGLLPTGETVPVDDRTDLRDGPDLGDRPLDDCYVGVRGPVAVTSVGFTLTVHAAEPVVAVVLHATPDVVCVEPQTAWPDAPTLAEAGHGGTGLVTLGAGETLTARQTWAWTTAIV